MNELKKESIKEISNKYLEIFNEYKYDNKENNLREKSINQNIKLFQELYKQYLIIGATISKEMFNIKREQNTINFITKMFKDLEQAMPNKKKRLANIKETATPICSVSIIFKIFQKIFFNIE